jgi:hypothetical protein
LGHFDIDDEAELRRGRRCAVAPVVYRDPAVAEE